MRDSLFWNLIVPEEELGMQVYTFVNHRGRAGYNVCVWGGDMEPVVAAAPRPGRPRGRLRRLGTGRACRSASPSCGEPRRCASRPTTSRLEYEFEALHEAFSYRQNPGGLPAWFAQNRFEQAGRVRGVLAVRGRHDRVRPDRAPRPLVGHARLGRAAALEVAARAHAVRARAERVRVDRARRVGLQRLRAARRRAGRDRAHPPARGVRRRTWTSAGSRRCWSWSTGPRPSSRSSPSVSSGCRTTTRSGP